MSRKEFSEKPSKRRKLSHGTQSSTSGAQSNEPAQSDLGAPGSSRTGSEHQKGSGQISTAEQVQRILSKASPKAGSRFKNAIETANGIIKDIRDLPAQGPFSAVEAVDFMQKQGPVAIAFPSPRPAKDSKLKFEYVAPSIVVLQSAPAQRLELQATKTVNITAQMPPDLFQEKDYLNLRAFHKRAFYLARIAIGLRHSFTDKYLLQYEYSHDLKLLPVLRLTPRDDTSAKNISYRVNVSLPSGLLPAAKTAPGSNCLRSTADATPFYNACLCQITSTLLSDQLVENAVKEVPNFEDSCRLGQLWLRHRRMSGSLSEGGFGHEEWSMLCALLLFTGGPRGGPLFSTRYSSVQLFKAMLQILSSRDMRDPWVLREKNINVNKSGMPVLYDGETGVNILYKMTESSYQTLRDHAQSSLASIGTKSSNSLEDTSLEELAEELLQYDEIYSINRFEASADAAFQMAPLSKLSQTLKRGFGDRIQSLDLRSQQKQRWDIKSTHSEKFETVRVALKLDPKNAARLVDHGPPAESQEEAKAFQDFWGDRAEVRRFKDGSITESLVWNSTEPVPAQILQQLLRVHFAMNSDNLELASVNVAELLPDSISDAAEYFAIINQTFQKLSSTLLGLTGLPLPVRSVSPASEALRSASLSTLLRQTATETMDVLIGFDTSGRWPDSLSAIQHTKIAFLIKLGDVLTAADASLTTRVGLENLESGITGHFNTSFLEIIYPSPQEGMSPVVFRVRIAHEREGHLLQGLLNDKSIKTETRDSLAASLASFKRHFIASARHSNALRVLMTQFPALSATIRLLKGWISAHLLSQHVPAEALEIIVCHIFLAPSPWSTPTSPSTAFLRCLAFLARWDWASVPLICDLSPGKDLSDAARADLLTRFQAWRKLDPMMNQVSWFIGSSIDETGTVWTGRNGLEKVIAARVQALATACFEVVRVSEDSWTVQAAGSLFQPPLEDHDFLITLQQKLLNSRKKPSVSEEGFRNLVVDIEAGTGSIGLDPVQDFVNELNGVLGGTALFLYGQSGHAGKVIAGLWRPSTHGQKAWRVRLGWSSKPASSEAGQEDEACVLNKEGVLKEIELIGKGLVKDVQLLR